MLLLIAWRNVWRNKKRSFIIIAAIAVGLWAGLFSMSVSLGVIDQMISAALATRISHIQIHRPGFTQHHEIGLTLPDGGRLVDDLRSRPGVRGAAPRVVLSGMASSPATASGIEIYGVNPEDERRVTDLSQQLVEGTYFESGKRNSAVIGKKLAEKLNAKVGSKIVLTSQDASGDLAAGAFRIAGIFKTSSTIFDEGIVFILRPDAGRTFGLDENIHEIALVLDDSKKVAEFSRELGKELEGLDVESWRELAPDLALATESASQQLYIFLIIILLAMVFGITNTMLMGVIERTRELGVLMALGMKGSRIFTMIFLETLALTAVGALIGILLGSGTIHIFGRVGLDMSLFSEGLAAFGMGSVWYPTLPLKEYPIIVLLSAATAIISSLYPGIKAVRLKPVEAIRSY